MEHAFRTHTFACTLFVLMHVCRHCCTLLYAWAACCVPLSPGGCVRMCLPSVFHARSCMEHPHAHIRMHSVRTHACVKALLHTACMGCLLCATLIRWLRAHVPAITHGTLMLGSIPHVCACSAFALLRSMVALSLPHTAACMAGCCACVYHAVLHVCSPHAALCTHAHFHSLFISAWWCGVRAALCQACSCHAPAPLTCITDASGCLCMRS